MRRYFWRMILSENRFTLAPTRPSAPDHALLVRRLLAVGVALGRAGQNLFGDQAGVLADRTLDLAGLLGIGLEDRLGFLAPLPEPLAVIGEPGAGFLDDAGLDGEGEYLSQWG